MMNAWLGLRDIFVCLDGGRVNNRGNATSKAPTDERPCVRDAA